MPNSNLSGYSATSKHAIAMINAEMARKDAETAKKVGLNTIANRLSILNGRIPLQWVTATLDTFKVRCKKLFLDNQTNL